MLERNLIFKDDPSQIRSGSIEGFDISIKQNCAKIVCKWIKNRFDIHYFKISPSKNKGKTG